MAVYKIFPTQDTTLYSLYPEMNTGLEELNKKYCDQKQISFKDVLIFVTAKK
jgi:hypothetical protein